MFAEPPTRTRDLLPTSQDVEHYKEHGWYVSKQIFSEEIIDEALAASERFYNGERDFEVPEGMLKALNWKPGAGVGLRLNDFVSFQSKPLGGLVLSPVLGAIAARLANTTEIRLFNSSAVYKPPEQPGTETRVGWHNDRAYWGTCTSANMLTAWIPLHDCDETMGTITMIDGSHLWQTSESLSKLRSEKSFLCNDLAHLENSLERLGMEIKRVSINLKKGQVSFHHCLVFHGSGANKTRIPRRALAVHLQDKDNKYQVAYDVNGQKCVYKADLICRKTNDLPDYSDPVIFPTLWRDDTISF